MSSESRQTENHHTPNVGMLVELPLWNHVKNCLLCTFEDWNAKNLLIQSQNQMMVQLSQIHWNWFNLEMTRKSKMNYPKGKICWWCQGSWFMAVSLIPNYFHWQFPSKHSSQLKLCSRTGCVISLLSHWTLLLLRVTFVLWVTMFTQLKFRCFLPQKNKSFLTLTLVFHWWNIWLQVLLLRN